MVGSADLGASVETVSDHLGHREHSCVDRIASHVLGAGPGIQGAGSSQRLPETSRQGQDRHSPSEDADAVRRRSEANGQGQGVAPEQGDHIPVGPSPVPSQHGGHERTERYGREVCASELGDVSALCITMCTNL